MRWGVVSLRRPPGGGKPWACGAMSKRWRGAWLAGGGADKSLQALVALKSDAVDIGIARQKSFARRPSNRRQMFAARPRWRATTFARTMIRLGQQVRLTRREVERFTRITDIAPVGIRTLAEFDAYIARCKAHYWGMSRETQFLHWLIDREYQQCRWLAVRQ